MEKNSTILEKAWLAGTNDFQQRVSNPAIAGVERTIADIMEPCNADLWNQFTGTLNRIATTLVHGRRYTNPLAPLKKGSILWGKSVQNIAVKWLKAHAYAHDSQTLLKFEKPEFATWFNSVNREERYEFSWTMPEVAQAFTSSDEYAANDLIAKTLDAAYSSDSLGEYECAIEQIAYAHKHWPGGLYMHYATEPNDEASAKAVLKAIKAYKLRLRTPSRLYNSIDVPVFINMDAGDKPLLLATPEVIASLDVDALATLFHMEKAEFQERIIPINEFPIDGVYAILTTEDFFDIRDNVFTAVSMFNPETLSDKNYLHHWEAIGLNPFVPCICFTSDSTAASSFPTITFTPSGIEAYGEIGGSLVTTAPIGGAVKIVSNILGTLSDDTTLIRKRPDAVRCTGIAISGSGTLNARTYMDDAQVLHIQKSGLSEGDDITLTLESCYSGDTFTTTLALEVAEQLPEGVGVLSFVNSPDATLAIYPDDVDEQLADMTEHHEIGETVDLSETVLPTTTWTTDDGEVSGTPGEWAAELANDTVIMTDAVTVPILWTFTAS